MTDVKFVLFVKPDCQDCTSVKERGVPPDTEIVDATTVNGMARAAFFEVLKEKMPVLVSMETGSVVPMESLTGTRCEAGSCLL